MANTAPAGAKGKKPPTFQHLPLNRAKKLKRSWVEVQKIKSKWKAQKRKEGLVQRRPATSLQTEVQKGPLGNEVEENADPESENGDEEGGGEENEMNTETSEGEQEKSDTRMEVPEEQHMSAERSKNKGKAVDRTRPSSMQNKIGLTERRRQHITGQEHDQNKPTLREMSALAYSRSSLHTFKSGRTHLSEESRGRGRGRGASRGSPAGRGRGQPDMRLRMNAMLEKIKRGLV